MVLVAKDYKIIVVTLALIWCIFLMFNQDYFSHLHEKGEFGSSIYRNMVAISSAMPFITERKSFVEKRRDIVTLLSKEGALPYYDDELNIELIKLDNDRLGDIFNSKIEKNLYFDNLPEIVLWLRREKRISQQLAGHINKIHELTRLGKDSKSIIRAINALKYAKLTAIDISYRDAFVVSYISLYTFWRSKSSERFRVSSLNCNRDIVLSGAAGALYGVSVSTKMASLYAATFSTLAIINPPCKKASI